MTETQVNKIEQQLRELTGADLTGYVNDMIPMLRLEVARLQMKREMVGSEHRQFRRYWDGVVLAVDAPVVAPDADVSRRDWFLFGTFAAIAAEVGISWWILSNRGFDSVESAIGATILAGVTTLVAELGLGVAHGLGKLWLDDTPGEVVNLDVRTAGAIV